MKTEKKQVSTSLSINEITKIKKMAENERRSFSQMMMVLLEEAIEKRILLQNLEKINQ